MMEAETVATASITNSPSYDQGDNPPDYNLGRTLVLKPSSNSPSKPSSSSNIVGYGGNGDIEARSTGSVVSGGASVDGGRSLASRHVFNNNNNNNQVGSYHGSNDGSDAPSVVIESKGMAPPTKRYAGENEVILKRWIYIGMLVLLFLLTITSGYFVADWLARGKPSPTSILDNENSDRDAPTIVQCQEETVDCEFSADDVLKLEQEIDRLEDANGVLADQLVEYDRINDRLNASIQELRDQNVILSENNDRYEELNGQLNSSIADLAEQNEILAEQVDIYTNLNTQLNNTSQELTEQVDRLEGEVDELSNQNDRLEGLVETLSNETDALDQLNDQLETNVANLEDQIDELSDENDRLESLTDDLQVVASFLNDTASNLNEAYEDIAATLAEQITTNRVLVLESLQNTYHQRVMNWDCAFYDTFALEEFVQGDGSSGSTGNVAIPDNKMNDVMGYVEDRVLNDLSLNTQDFVEYMENRYPNQDITTNRLLTSVQRYTWYALDYYFPEFSDNEEGLTPIDWANASYECSNLESLGKQFTMDVM